MVRSGNSEYRVNQRFKNRLFIGGVFGIIGIEWNEGIRKKC
jgi:hypothetical protein